MLKRIILIALCLINIMTISLLSTQNSEASDQLSENLAKTIMSPLNQQEDTPPKIPLWKGNQYIRSLAHFILFLTLGLLLYLTLYNLGVKHSLLYAFAICVIYALFDEVYQELLHRGRSFEYIDLLKDWAGSCVGIILSRLIIVLKKP